MLNMVFGIGDKIGDFLVMYLEDIYMVFVNLVGFFVFFILCGFDLSGFFIGL